MQYRRPPLSPFGLVMSPLPIKYNRLGGRYVDNGGHALLKLINHNYESLYLVRSCLSKMDKFSYKENSHVIALYAM